MTASLEVTAVAGPVSVQDGGRPGQMHHGVPPGGALVPELLAAANRAVGNPWNAAALECHGRLELRIRERPVRVSVDGRAFTVAPGQPFTVPSPDATSVRYVALAGGLAVPEVLGGRGTLQVAHLGGHEGRSLRAGDVLPLGTDDALPPAGELALGDALDADAPVRVLLGPDAEQFGEAALSTLLGRTFTLAPATDRVGMRLQGATIPHADEGTGTSRPMVRGAIQVTLSGEPIVLGPDHPTTGGYRLIATVIRADWGRLAARRPGAPVRFASVDEATARACWRRHLALRTPAT